MTTAAKRAVASAFLAATALATTGCGDPATEQASTSTNLQGAVLALSLQPQEMQFASGSHNGAIVLVDSNGETREIKTAGMDQGQIDFSDGELYFADVERGYFAGQNSTTIVSRETTDQMEGLLRIGGGYVGVYNEGGDLASESSEDYLFQLLHTTRTPATAQFKRVGGYFRALAACGDDVLGVAHNPSTVPGLLTLKRLHPSEQLVAQSRFPTAMEFEGLSSPCRDETMYFLGMPTNPEAAPPPQQMLLFRWNVTSGEVDPLPLTTRGGMPLRQSLDQKLYTRSDIGSLDDGTFHWLDGNGRILATDITNGVTRTVAETGFNARTDQAMQVSFEHPGVMLSVRKVGVADEVVLTAWNLATGDPTEVMRVSGVTTGPERVLRDFAYWGDRAPCAKDAC